MLKEPGRLPFGFEDTVKLSQKKSIQPLVILLFIIKAKGRTYIARLYINKDRNLAEVRVTNRQQL